MYLVRLSILLLVCSAMFGCRPSMAFIHDHKLYENGNPKSEADIDSIKSQFISYKYEHYQRHSTEYYENGRLKSEEWSQGHQPGSRLEYYENSRLKSEERFLNGKLVYGVYYTENGQIERTSGSLMDWLTLKNP
jgi:antitoxin component YwqK of YwqJK toxin-antitoxin module